MDWVTTPNLAGYYLICEECLIRLFILLFKLQTVRRNYDLDFENIISSDDFFFQDIETSQQIDVFSNGTNFSHWRFIEIC